MRNWILIISSLFVIGALAGPNGSTENEIDYYDGDYVKVFTWPEIKGITYQVKVGHRDSPFPELYIRLANKTVDNNPDGDTVFMKTDSIRVTANGDLSYAEYTELFQSHSISLGTEDAIYDFNQDDILSITIPKVGSIKMKALIDGSMVTDITVDYKDERIISIVTSFYP